MGAPRARGGASAQDCGVAVSLRRFLTRSARDRDRAEEIETHLALAIEAELARGKTPEEAQRAARLKLGNARVKREEIDQMNRLPVLDVLGRDIRYAVRVLRRSPAFGVTAIATLALVIGANAAVFGLADAILLRPLPYPHPERLAMVIKIQKYQARSGTQESQDGAARELLREHATT